MSQDLPVLWSPAQQAWLQAMGYTVYHDGQLAADLDAALQLSVAQASAALPAEPSPVPPRREPAREPMASRRDSPDESTRRRPPVSTPDTVPEAQQAPVRSHATGAGTRQPVVRLPDRLQIALLRASGCNPSDPATQALMDSWPLEQLRRDPAAKRALWPVLRALRRQARP